ncbi:MAG: geranylgeranylglycerol-phosphate geranylgeranyltransferase [bacterium]
MNFDALVYLKLIRPVNVLLGALTIFVGAFITGTIQPLHKVVLACVSGVAIMGAGNAINDYFDIAIDRINKPFRPLPSALLDREAALKFAIILFVLGIFLSIFINWASFFLAVFIAVSLVGYSFRLKQTVLIGNLAVSLFSALAFVYGSLAVGKGHHALFPAGFAFLFHLGREIIKDIEDMEADRARSARTLPIRFGTRVALSAATCVFSLLICLTILPFSLDIYGKAYFIVALIGIDFVIVCILCLMWLYPFPESLRRISLVLKADMFIGLFAIYLGIQSS